MPPDLCCYALLFVFTPLSPGPSNTMLCYRVKLAGSSAHPDQLLRLLHQQGWRWSAWAARCSEARSCAVANIPVVGAASPSCVPALKIATSWSGRSGADVAVAEPSAWREVPVGLKVC